MFKADKRIRFFYVAIDLIVIGATFYICYSLRYNEVRNLFYNSNLPNWLEYSVAFALWTIFLTFFFKRKELYSTNRSLGISDEIRRVVLGNVCAAILIAALIFTSQYKFFSRQVFFRSILFLSVSLSIWRIIKRLILRKLIAEGLHNMNVLIVGAGRVGRIILEEIRMNPYWGFKVVGFLDDKRTGFIDEMPVLGKLSDFVSIAKKNLVDEAIVTIPSEKKAVSGLMDKIKTMRMGLRIVPENFEGPLPALDISYLGITPLLTYKAQGPHPAEFALKRLFDFLVALILIVIFSPLYLTSALSIKLSSPGPIFYIRKRVGFKGRQFNFYKFRSMVKEADELKNSLWAKNEVKDGVIFKIKKDPRITGIGRLLRRYSIDELPQLFNVLKGDMSLVGPRPPVPSEVDKYDHEQIQRLSIRPGITGLSQIKGRSELTFKNWVRWDLWYINKWSFWLDLVILFRTIPVVFKGKGAY